MNTDTANYADRPHALIVDDDSRIRRLVSRYLKDQGFVASTACNAAEARDILGQCLFDVYIVDLMMPGEDGLSLTRHLRDKSDDTPVLMLTALGETEDRIQGLESGADDYLPKPFEPRELILRLRALLRRRPAAGEGRNIYHIGPWTFDVRGGLLNKPGADVSLTELETALLQALASRSGRVLSREDLARICGLQTGPRSIDVQITRLRRKLETQTRTPRYLQTVRGRGYVLYTDYDSG